MKTTTATVTNTATITVATHCLKENKAGYTTISRVRLGSGSNAQKSTNTLRKKKGVPTDKQMEGLSLHATKNEVKTI